MSTHFRITTTEGGRAATVEGLAPGEYAAKREALLSPETKVGQTRYSESAVTTAETLGSTLTAIMRAEIERQVAAREDAAYARGYHQGQRDHADRIARFELYQQHIAKGINHG